MRVLVVDDDADFCLLARRALEAGGHEVECISAAFGLVNRVAGSGGNAPDIVVLDCDLPGLSGFAAIELLARDRRTSGVPVLLVSATSTEQHHAAAALHPVATFHQKDGRMKTFVARLEEHATAKVTAAVSR